MAEGGDSTRVGGVHIELTLQGTEQAKVQAQEAASVISGSLTPSAEAAASTMKDASAAAEGNAEAYLRLVAAANAAGASEQEVAEAARAARDDLAAARAEIEANAASTEAAFEKLGSDIESRFLRIGGMIMAVKEGFELGKKIGEEFFVTAEEKAEEDENKRTKAWKENMASRQEAIEKLAGEVSKLRDGSVAELDNYERLFKLFVSLSPLYALRNEYTDRELASAEKRLKIAQEMQRLETEAHDASASSEERKKEDEKARKQMERMDAEERRVDERNQKEIDAYNKKLDDDEAAFEDRMHREDSAQYNRDEEHARRLSEAAEKAADKFSERIEAAFDRITDKIQSGVFGIGSSGGDFSQIQDLLERIERVIPRGLSS